MIIDKINKNIAFSSFEILHDASYGGYKIKLAWEASKDAVFYKIYKSILPKNTLSKNFEINQKTLEKVSKAPILLNSQTNILYNKDVFVKSANVDLLNSSNKFLDVKSDYKFFEVAQIIAEKNKTNIVLVIKILNLAKAILM